MLEREIVIAVIKPINRLSKNESASKVTHFNKIFHIMHKHKQP
jgi:hypothetical protein